MKFPPRLATTALLLLMTSVAMPAFSTPPTANNLHPTITIPTDDTTHEVEILRCHFNEERLVARYGGELHVLRSGDRLAAMSLRVLEITPTSATLAVQQAAGPGGNRIIRMTRSESGDLLLREYASDPAALSVGSAAGETRVPVSTNHTGALHSESGADSPDGTER